MRTFWGAIFRCPLPPMAIHLDNAAGNNWGFAKGLWPLGESHRKIAPWSYTWFSGISSRQVDRCGECISIGDRHSVRQKRCVRSSKRRIRMGTCSGVRIRVSAARIRTRCGGFAAVRAALKRRLRAFFSFAPRSEFDSPRACPQKIKKQVDSAIYLLVPCGGGAENRTPVHESPLIGISRLSR